MCIAYIVNIVLLGVNAIRDVYKREILLWVSAAAGVTGLVYRGVSADPIFSVMLSLIPGMVLIFLALSLKGQIGIGDGIMTLVLGCWNSLEHTAGAVLAAMFIIVIFAGALTLLHKGKKYLPFIPFLLAGEIVVILFG